MKKKVFYVVLLVVISLGLAACSKGKDKAPEITQVEKENGLQTMLKKQQYTFDNLEKIKFKDSEVSEKDMTKLKQLFESRVDFVKNDVEVTLSTNASKTAGEFSIVYAYYDDSWQAVFAYPINEKGWVSEAKSRVNKKRVMEDLKAAEFKGFKKGEVGKESNTKVILNKRDEKIDIGRDILFTTVVVKTDFAKYRIDVDFTYQFKDGKWELQKMNIQDQKLWQIEYDKSNIPDALSQEAVIKKLTNKKNFLTYVTNKDYPTNTMLSETRQSVGVDELAYVFSWITEYADIGKITYKVEMPYKFSDGEWDEGKQKVTVDKINIDEMVGKWTGENGDEIEFDKTLKSKKTENRDAIVGTYYTVREIDESEVDPTTDPFKTGLMNKEEEKDSEDKSEEKEEKEEKEEIDPDDPLGEKKELSTNDKLRLRDELNKLADKVKSKDSEFKSITEFDKANKKLEKEIQNDKQLKEDFEEIRKDFKKNCIEDLPFEQLKEIIGTDKIKNEDDLEVYLNKRIFSDDEKLELKTLLETSKNQKNAKKVKKVKAEYSIRLKLEVDKKDDGWNLNILKFEPKNTSSIKFDIEDAHVDLKNKYIIIDGVKYSKKPIEEENPEAIGKNDGIKVDSLDVNVPAYVIEGENYFKIRDLAYALKDSKAKFKVDYDKKIGAVVVEPGKDYEPMDGDMEPIKNPKSVGVRSSDKLVINGDKAEIKAYKIEGFNYFRLRDLGDIIGFGVDYDFENNKVVISSEISKEDLEKQREKNKKNNKKDEGDKDESKDSKIADKDSDDTSAFDEEFNDGEEKETEEEKDQKDEKDTKDNKDKKDKETKK